MILSFQVDEINCHEWHKSDHPENNNIELCNVNNYSVIEHPDLDMDHQCQRTNNVQKSNSVGKNYKNDYRIELSKKCV